MERCMSCGKNSLFTANFGNTVLCKNCASLISISEWSNREFDSRDELILKKDQVIQKAKASNISPNVINEIAIFFDEYINGWGLLRECITALSVCHTKKQHK